MSDDSNEEISLRITENDKKDFKRLDQYLDKKLSDYSRTFLKRLFLNKLIYTNNDSIQLELKKMPPVDTEIFISVPPPLETNLKAQNIPLEILYEDQHLVVINKPAGLVTHPAPGHYNNTLVNAILYHCPDLEGVGEVKRPGIVHRLDKGTSGVMVVAKTQKAHEGLVLLFSSHDIERYYEAITLGPEVPVGGTLKSMIGRDPKNRLKMSTKIKEGTGRHAITHYKVLKSQQRLHHIELKLETGRTHQIRVHLSELLKHPILSDPTYSSPKSQLNALNDNFKKVLNDYPHPLLHAKTLGFIHPITKKEIYIQKEPPKTFLDILALMDKRDE